MKSLVARYTCLVVVKNVVLMLAGLVVMVNFVVDILYAVIDPRIRVRG